MSVARFEFIVYGNPRGKGRPRFAGKSGHTYTDAATAEYEGRVKRMWKSETFYKLTKQPTSIKIIAFFPVPISLPKKRRADMFGAPCLRKPDADNIAKIILDALNGLAYEDDSQICDLLVIKQYVESDEDRPRVEITILGDGE